MNENKKRTESYLLLYNQYVPYYFYSKTDGIKPALFYNIETVNFEHKLCAKFCKKSKYDLHYFDCLIKKYNFNFIIENIFKISFGYKIFACVPHSSNTLTICDFVDSIDTSAIYIFYTKCLSINKILLLYFIS